MHIGILRASKGRVFSKALMSTGSPCLYHGEGTFWTRGIEHATRRRELKVRKTGEDLCMACIEIAS